MAKQTPKKPGISKLESIWKQKAKKKEYGRDKVRHSKHSGYPFFNVPEKEEKKMVEEDPGRGRKNERWEKEKKERHQTRPGEYKKGGKVGSSIRAALGKTHSLKKDLEHTVKKGLKAGSSIKTYSNGGYVEGK